MPPGSIVEQLMSIFMLLVELHAEVGWDMADPRHGKKPARPRKLMYVIKSIGTHLGSPIDVGANVGVFVGSRRMVPEHVI